MNKSSEKQPKYVLWVLFDLNFISRAEASYFCVCYYMSRDMTKPTKWLCAQRSSDQPGHPSSLIRLGAMRSMGSLGPNVSSCGQQNSDQTGRMPRLIWVFAWTHSHFVGFVMSRLIYSGAWILSVVLPCYYGEVFTLGRVILAFSKINFHISLWFFISQVFSTVEREIRH